MQLTHVTLKHFRCFSEVSLDIQAPIVLIEGLNGTGKTSLLEALHYLCYLRSFRTYTPHELVQFGSDSFFIKATITNQQLNVPMIHDIQVGFTGSKRSVKVDQKALTSYKELMQFYRIVTLTEDDLALIKEGPEARRLFIDQAALLENPSFIALSKSCRHTVDNRNALLKQGAFNHESYRLWTEQLWQKTGIIAQERIAYLAKLQEQLHYLIDTYFKGSFAIQLTYQPKYLNNASFEEFMNNNPGLADQEKRMGRSLFGAHLDDFAIIFQDKKSKSFASRGQQKLIVLLLKIAHIRSLIATTGPAIFLLDDYMTDFDPSRSELLLNALIDLNCQLIFTSPVAGGPLEKHLLDRGAQKVHLTP